MTIQQLQLMCRTFSDLFGVTCAVAGGAIRDTLMGRIPKDYDIFLLGPADPPILIKDIQEKLGKIGFTNLTTDYPHSEPFMVGQWKLGEVIYQFMHRQDIGSLKELIDTFDWNVSLFGVTETKIIARTPLNAIAPGKELTLQKLTYPIASLRRGFRFAERFQMHITNDTIKDIAFEIGKLKDGT